MGRRGNGKKGEGQYAPLPYALLKSPAWRSLSGAAVRVFLELHTRYNGSNNAALRLSYAEASQALGIGKATVQRAFRELQDKGMVVLEREGNWYHRQAHEWRITTKPVQRVKGKEPPSHDWRNYRPEKEKRGSDMVQQKASVVPFKNPSGPHGSKPEPVRVEKGERNGSRSEH
ncbi:helix-turn-helix transcriptional regulator [Cognatishimia sp. F0-27]|nr:helix-turn-helix transcriptional regulator [Cognatishimia sp. F0-27]